MKTKIVAEDLIRVERRHWLEQERATKWANVMPAPGEREESESLRARLSAYLVERHRRRRLRLALYRDESFRRLVDGLLASCKTKAQALGMMQKLLGRLDYWQLALTRSECRHLHPQDLVAVVRAIVVLRGSGVVDPQQVLREPFLLFDLDNIGTAGEARRRDKWLSAWRGLVARELASMVPQTTAKRWACIARLMVLVGLPGTDGRMVRSILTHPSRFPGKPTSSKPLSSSRF